MLNEQQQTQLLISHIQRALVPKSSSCDWPAFEQKDYLRIIYDAEYGLPDHLQRLKNC